MKTGIIRDFIVENNLEEDLLNYSPKSEREILKEWLESEDLSF